MGSTPSGCFSLSFILVMCLRTDIFLVIQHYWLKKRFSWSTLKGEAVMSSGSLGCNDRPTLAATELPYFGRREKKPHLGICDKLAPLKTSPPPQESRPKPFSVINWQRLSLGCLSLSFYESLSHSHSFSLSSAFWAANFIILFESLFFRMF